MKNKKIIFASDCVGVELKSGLIAYGRSIGLDIEDIELKGGSPLDYVDLAKQLVTMMLHDSSSIGVLVCGDGQGATMASNKFNLVRAALCNTVEDAILARCRLNSNVLCLGKRELMEEMNLTATMVDFIGALECTWDKKGSIYHELNLVYKIESPNLSLEHPPESTEAFIKFIWCAISDLPKHKILPQKLIPMIQETVKHRNNALFYSQMI